MEQASRQSDCTVDLPETSPIPSAPAATFSTNPFPGLRPFREDEEHLFFGRERQVDAMVGKLAKTRFLAVVGTSGSGKSSLVNCGLRPALHRGLMTSAGTAWRMIQFRPGGSPLKAMARALSAKGVLYSDYEGTVPLDEIVDTHLRLSKRGLIDLYRKAPISGGANLLIVVDQFEELFRYRTLGLPGKDQFGMGQEAIAFVNLLLEVQTCAECPIYVVLTMRSDFLGDCSQCHGLPEAINEGQYLVPRLSREERRAAIAGPVRVAGGDINPVLLTRLVNDVGDNPDQLSILQHALNRTWARWRHEGRTDPAMSLGHYEAIGTMAHALDQHAEKAFNELTTERQGWLCKKIFKALTDKATDVRGIRRPMSLQSLALLTGARADEIKEVIDVFRKPSRSFLMPPIGETLEPDTVIDISHESLMRVWERLNQWSDEEAESARMYRRLAETASLYEAGKAGLWRDPDLQFGLDWQQRESPTAAWANLYQGNFERAISFLDQSKAVHDEELARVEFERRWQKTVAPILIVLMLVLFLGSFERLSPPLLRVLGGSTVQKEKVEPIREEAVKLESKIEQVKKEVPNEEQLKDAVFSGQQLKQAIAAIFIGIVFFLCYLLLAHYGKQILRGITFKRVVQQVAAGTGQAVINRNSPPRPFTEAVIALNTSYAGFWRRFLGYVIDLFVFVVEFFVVFATIGIILGISGSMNAGGDVSDRAITIGYVLLILGDSLYYAIMTSSGWQATLGMKAVGILVTDLGGNRLSFRRAFARHWAKILSYYSAIGFFLQLFTKRKQALHDLITRSVVLRDPKRRSMPTTAPPTAPIGQTSSAAVGMG